MARYGGGEGVVEQAGCVLEGGKKIGKQKKKHKREMR